MNIAPHYPECGSSALTPKFMGFRCSECGWKGMYPAIGPKKAQSQPQVHTKETIIKEIVMIPCSYCQALMPQTSVFCPHCGARRKA